MCVCVGVVVVCLFAMCNHHDKQTWAHTCAYTKSTISCRDHATFERIGRFFFDENMSWLTNNNVTVIQRHISGFACINWINKYFVVLQKRQTAPCLIEVKCINSNYHEWMWIWKGADPLEPWSYSHHVIW